MQFNNTEWIRLLRLPYVSYIIIVPERVGGMCIDAYYIDISNMKCWLLHNAIDML